MLTGRVIFTVFAGRRRFMHILMGYVQPLLQEGVVDEVHIWDYCKVAADREYLKGLTTSAALRVMTPPPSDLTAKFPNKWKGYYAHYAHSLRDDDLLIKCDDDVVFIANLHRLLAFARADGGAHHLYFPSIVNNDVSAAFQAADGVITDPEFTVELQRSRLDGPHSRAPMSDWYNCTACAEHVHSLFLGAPSRFFTGCAHTWAVPARVPINFFVMPGRRVREHFSSYAKEAYVDEAYLTALLTERTGVPSVLVSDAVVVHLAFAFQHLHAPRDVLERYRKLARDATLLAQLKADFGARPLNHSCAATAPAAQRQGRRVRIAPPAQDRPLGRGKGAGFGRHSGIGAHSQPWTTR